VARRAALDEQFRTLPPAGSGAYWRLIEATGAQQPTPLEVLARCIQERTAATANEDAQRIFTNILSRIQDTTRHWARLVAKQAHSGMRPQLQEDLEQEAYLKLWEELTDEGPTFLLENFTFAYSRLRQHVAQSVMERAGERQRPGAAQSNRVPRAQIDSLQKERPGEDEPLYITRLADASAQEAFEGAELSDLLAAVYSLPLDDRTLILDRFWNDKPQEETAAKLGISSRMVRYRLKAILRDLGVRYRGDEEDHHG
jgi:RNA polymerase sigma factor (sigma-70 family)